MTPQNAPTELLFSYGTLQLEDVQMYTFGRLLTGRADTLIGFEAVGIELDDPATTSLSGKSWFTIIRCTGRCSDRVEGTVYALTQAELRAADDYEVVPYERIAVVLQSGVRAWAYVDGAAGR